MAAKTGAPSAPKRGAGKAPVEPAHSLLYAPKDLPPVAGAPDTEALLARVKTTLPANRQPNEQQQKAFHSSFHERLTLLWGPPGTGKTDTLAATILGWLEHAWETGRPLILGVGSSNWTAIDNVLRKVLPLVEARADREKPPLDLCVARVRGDHSSPPPTDLPYVWDVRRNSEDSEVLLALLARPDRCILLAGTWMQLVKLSKQKPSSPDAGEDAEYVDLSDEAENGEGEAEEERQGWFDLLVLDEASQVKVTEAAGYFRLARPEANVVLAGDDRQLGPVYAVQMKDDEGGLLDCAYRYYRERHKWPHVPLTMNYRTNREIADWPARRFYEEGYEAYVPGKRLDVTMPGLEEKPDGWPEGLPWSPAYWRLMDPEWPVVALTYPAQPYTMYNPFEAETVAALATLFRLLLRAQGEADDLDFWNERLGIVTPHRAQMSGIRNLLIERGGFPATPAPAVDTVDRFQGQERDFMLASYAVADRDYVGAEEDFILSPRRFNVTITRARSKVVLLVSDAIVHHLPNDRQVALDAAHLQLFVTRFCADLGTFPLPGPNGAAMACRLRGHRAEPAGPGG